MAYTSYIIVMKMVLDTMNFSNIPITQCTNNDALVE